MSEKKPQAGEWWNHRSDGLCFVSGFDTDGDPVYVFDDGNRTDLQYMDDFCEQAYHLPDCTGWDWKPEVCTCPTLDGVKVIGSACPLHGLPTTTLKDLPPLPDDSGAHNPVPFKQAGTIKVSEFKPVDPLNWPHSEQPKRVSVRLWWCDDCSVCATEGDEPLHDEDEEIKFDGQRFYVEETK